MSASDYKKYLTSSVQIPWIEKYRPKKIENVEQSESILQLFKNNIKTGDMTHYIFYGFPGTGKTSAIQVITREIFKEHYKSRVIEFNASDERGINDVRQKIATYAKRSVSKIEQDDGTIIPPYKVIILDEADSMTEAAQDALRVIIEKYSNVTRFCFICNFISKISDAIKSRCTLIYFNCLTEEAIINKIKYIAGMENMELSDELYETISKIADGDMRKAVMLLQNVKYTYDFKKNKKQEIAINDIYHISGIISIQNANVIIKHVSKCKTVNEISCIAKDVISLGYPIDTIVKQISSAIIESKTISDENKAHILIHTGKTMFQIKECTNIYIQLIDYFLIINKKLYI